MFHPSLPLSHELPRSLDIPPAPDLMSTQTKLLSSIVSCANYCSANLPSGLIPKFIQEAEQLGGSAVNTTYPAGSKAARALRGELSLRERGCLLGSWFYQSALQIKTCPDVFPIESGRKRNVLVTRSLGAC